MLAYYFPYGSYKFHRFYPFVLPQLISVKGELCIRGYWRTPDDVSKARVLDWFEEQIQKIGLSDLKDTLYFTQSPGMRKSIGRSFNIVSHCLFKGKCLINQAVLCMNICI